jgi:hypothetical protein
VEILAVVELFVVMVAAFLGMDHFGEGGLDRTGFLGVVKERSHFQLIQLPAVWSWGRIK